MRGVQFWTDELTKTGIAEKMPAFNDVITGTRPPSADMKPLVTDAILGGKKVDVYHWGGGSARVYLHIKD